MARADAHCSGTAEEAEFRTGSARAVTRFKRPNQKQYNKELADICAAIGKLLEEQKVLDTKERAEADECRKIRQEKSAEFAKKSELEATLRIANQEVVSKSDYLAKLQINLHYKNEARLDDAIRRLEAQLGSCSWKQSEEKKVLDEIDSLKRSKNTLVQYNQLKEELDVLKQQVKLTRLAREEVFQSLSVLKAKEDQHSRARADSRARGTDVQAELDAFFEAKRKLKDEFVQQKGAYNAQKAEEQQRAQDRARLAAEQRKKTQPHVEVVKKYHDREHQLCSMLMPYLHRLAGCYLDTADDAQATAPARELRPEVEGMQQLGGGTDGTGAEREGLAVAASALKKRGKKKRKHRLDKPLRHTPEAVSWFIELRLTAPATAADIGHVMEQLTVIKARHEPAAASSGVGPERLALAALDHGPPPPELCLRSPASQLASSAHESWSEAAAATASSDVDGRAQTWPTDKGISGCADSLTEEDSGEAHCPPVTCPPGAAAAGLSGTPDCCRSNSRGSEAGCGTNPDAPALPPIVGGADAAPAAQLPCSGAAPFPQRRSVSSAAAAVGTRLADAAADLVGALCSYEGKSFIQQSLTLAASGGRDDAMSSVTMA